MKTGTKVNLLCKPKIRNAVCLLAKYEVHMLMEEGHKLHWWTIACNQQIRNLEGVRKMTADHKFLSEGSVIPLAGDSCVIRSLTQ